MFGLKWVCFSDSKKNHTGLCFVFSMLINNLNYLMPYSV